MGPNPRIAEGPPRGYSLQRCHMSPYNHRMEVLALKPPMTESQLCIDCRKLHSVFPFVYNSEGVTKRSGQIHGQKVFPSSGTDVQPLVKTTIEQRNEWFAAPPVNAQKLTDAIPNLNEVEIDNKIAQAGEFGGNLLHVVEFNAARGIHWLESSELLKEADVIILNEMDIGMARSDQQHTTRLMAHHLGMNYAWGLEFVELTLGDQDERKNMGHSEVNFHGLHGNAILSKFPIHNATIFRNKVGSYFSDKPNNVNAGGLERRLGGRMILLGHIMVNGRSIVIGSTHKLGGFREDIKDYIGTANAIIAGDQGPMLCTDVGLDVIGSGENRPTWPASCQSYGVSRGDNICSNMKVDVSEYIVKPCFRQHGMNISIGDHAILGAIFQLS